MPDEVKPTEAPAPQEASAMPDREAIIAAVDAGKPPEAAPSPGAPPAKVEAPKTPNESALLRSLQKRERDLVQKTQAYAQQMAQAQATIAQQIEAGVQKALKERFADARKAVAGLNELGIENQKLADAMLHRADSPEEMARKALEESAALRRQMADREQVQVNRRLEEEFLGEAKAMAAKGELTHVYEEYEPAEILQATYLLINELKAECAREGKPVPNVSNDRWLQILEKRTKAKVERRLERQKAKGADATGKTAPQGDTKAATNGSGHQGVQTGASATTTLGKGLGERQSVVSPDPVAMTREEIIAAVNQKVADGFTVKTHL